MVRCLMYVYTQVERDEEAMGKTDFSLGIKLRISDWNASACSKSLTQSNKEYIVAIVILA